MLEERRKNPLVSPSLDYPPEDGGGVGRTMIMPMVPLRDMLVFPSMITHLDVGRDRSINAIDRAMLRDEHLLFLAMQKDAHKSEPRPEDIYPVGTVVQIRQLLKLPGGTVRLLVEGLSRAVLDVCIEQQPFLMARLTMLPKTQSVGELEMTALMRTLGNCFEEYARASHKISPEALAALEGMDDPERFADLIAAQMYIRSDEKQQLLAETCVNKRMELMLGFLYREMEILKLEHGITERVRQQIEQHQKEYYLREQIKAIQQELGEKDERAAEAAELRLKAKEAACPDFILEKLDKELETINNKKYVTQRFTEYFTIKEHSKNKITYNLIGDKVDEQVSRCGYFILLTNKPTLKSIDILEIYRNKDVIEKNFDQFKNELDFKRLKTHHISTTEGKMFVGFLALILRCYMLQTIKNKSEKDTMTFEKVMLELKKINSISLSNGQEILTTLTKTQKEILAWFRTNEKNLQTYKN
ncbi:MAG: LON peptidase substrate-binding domain-containing protein [Clostridiales bacterium]|nr:LON peptidase substrate-binding domain-containing protein [Clostridiales bacterium]